MDSLACQGVQEHRESRHEGLSLTGGHLGDAAHLILVGLNPSVQDDTSDQLDVVMDHVPGDLVSSCHPVVLINSLVALDRDEVVVDTEILVELGSLDHYGLVLLEPAGGGLHDSEGLRKNLFQSLLDLLILFLDQLVGFGGELFLLGDRNIFPELNLDFLYPFLKRGLALAEFLPQRLGLCPQLVVRQGVYRGISRQDLVQDGSYQLHVTIGLGAEYFS